MPDGNSELEPKILPPRPDGNCKTEYKGEFCGAYRCEFVERKKPWWCFWCEDPAPDLVCYPLNRSRIYYV